jgi:hypothetical protein
MILLEFPQCAGSLARVKVRLNFDRLTDREPA